MTTWHSFSGIGTEQVPFDQLGSFEVLLRENPQPIEEISDKKHRPGWQH